MQDYVNENTEMLSNAIIEVLPSRLRELRVSIQWISPLEQDDYMEYRDDDFLRALGFDDAITPLRSFWPSQGPSWDALARTSDIDGRLRPGVLLVEAKSHLSEMYGNGCQAQGESKRLIVKALAETQAWCGVAGQPDWLGPLYQYANRLAHLYFFRERLKQFNRPAWLVNIYFLNDPIGPADRAAWKAELEAVKAVLGLTNPVPYCFDIFLPALAVDAGVIEKAQAEADSYQDVQTPVDLLELSAHLNPLARGEVKTPFALGRPMSLDVNRSPISHETFTCWSERWLALARYPGSRVPDVSERIERLVTLWRQAIPGPWKRGLDVQLLGRRYRRGDLISPHDGEHSIEHAILCAHFERVSCLGGVLVDGINALPLVRDQFGGRAGNVEADLLLLLKSENDYRIVVCEVKDKSDTPWFAGIENLRQLRLLSESEETLKLFTSRNPNLTLPSYIPVTAIVVAPSDFYRHAGKKANAVIPTKALLSRFREEFDVDIRLAVWEAAANQVRPLE